MQPDAPDVPDAPDASDVPGNSSDVPEVPSPDDEFTHAWQLPAADTERGMHALGWCTGLAGELAVLLVDEQYLESNYPSGTLLSPSPCPAELVIVTGGDVRRTPVENVRAFGTHILALLPDHRFVLVNSRTRRRRPVGPWDPTARVFSASGRPESEFCPGDDIASLIADRRGRLWIVYGDEGIHGSGHPDSATGFAAWDTRGRSLWTGARTRQAGVLQGLASATDGVSVWHVWCAATRGTYLTRISTASGRATHCPSPAGRPSGFAVRGDRAVFVERDHGRPTAVLTRARLEDTTWTVTDRRRVSLPEQLGHRCSQGREGVLWLRAGDNWLTTAA